MAYFLFSKIPKRFTIAVMLFLACFTSFIVQAILSMTIVAMVNPVVSNSTADPPDYGPRYNWTQIDQGHLLGANFYGGLVAIIPSGMLADYFGGKLVIGNSCLLAGIITALTPLAASIGKWVVWILRFFIGIFMGTTLSCCYYLISKWAPPTERGKFMCALMGNTVGPMITLPLSAVIIKSLGWNWVFYIVAVYVEVVCGLWFWIVYDTPAEHTTISDEEREMIQQCLGDTVMTKKKWPPFCSLLVSLPFWGLLFLNFADMWGLFFMLTSAPKYLSEVLGFDIFSTGALLSLPYIARVAAAFGFGSLADFIRRRNWIGLTNLRKLFSLPSHIMPGVFLILLAFFGCDPYLCVALMTISLAFNGASTASNLPNAQDLAPNFAGSVFSILSCVGVTSGIFSTMVVATFTKHSNTTDEWFWIFVINAGVYLIPALLFWIIGSGRIQKWNNFEASSTEGVVINKKV